MIKRQKAEKCSLSSHNPSAVQNRCSVFFFFFLILSKVNNKAKQEASKQDDPLNQRDQNKKANGSNSAHPSKSFACFVGLMTSDVKTGLQTELCDLSS